MSPSLIKSAHAPRRMRAWSPVAGGAAAGSSGVETAETLPPSELAELRAQRDQLKAALTARDAEFAEMTRTREAALAAAEMRGRGLGRAEAAVDQAEALSRLEAGLREACAILSARLSTTEALAVALAQEALRKLLLEPAAPAALVTGLLRRQLAELEAGAVLAVEVSATDFPEPEALEDLARSAGLERAQLRAGDLPSGGCRIGLRLGSLEVGAATQWERLAATLGAPAPGDEAAA